MEIKVMEDMEVGLMVMALVYMEEAECMVEAGCMVEVVCMVEEECMEEWVTIFNKKFKNNIKLRSIWYGDGDGYGWIGE